MPEHSLELAEIETVYRPDPPPLIDASRITPLMITEYALWFLNTSNFYVQHPLLLPRDIEEGRGYLRVKAPINASHIRGHLIGGHTIGCYCIAPETQRVKWFAIDGDHSEVQLKMIEHEMREDGLFPAYEHSRRCGHLWVLCSDAVPAKMARVYLYQLLSRLNIPIVGFRQEREGMEIFPKQERLETEQVGSGLRGPLGVHRKAMKRYWFRDAEPEIEAQFAYLRMIPRCSYEQLEELTADMEMPEDLAATEQPANSERIEYSGREFNIGPYLDQRRFSRLVSLANLRSRSGRDASMTFACPACRACGHDRPGDNMNVTITADRSVPLFYCFAARQCSFHEIKAACEGAGAIARR